MHQLPSSLRSKGIDFFPSQVIHPQEDKPDEGKRYFGEAEIFRTSPFKVVKFGTKIGYFSLQKAQNLSGQPKVIGSKKGDVLRTDSP